MNLGNLFLISSTWPKQVICGLQDFLLIGQVTIASQFSRGFFIIAKNLETKSIEYHSLPPDNSPYVVVLLAAQIQVFWLCTHLGYLYLYLYG